MKKHRRTYKHELEWTYEKRKTGSSPLDAKRRLNPSRALSLGVESVTADSVKSEGECVIAD